MNGTDVDFAELFQGRTELKSGPDTRHCQALVKSIDTERRRITALASAGTIDRDGEIIEPEAFRESSPGFMKNPVVLAAHQHRLSDGRSPVVGNVVAAKIDKDGLNVEIEFHDETELAREYWRLYSKKIQRALSVGFIPQDGGHKQINGKSVFAHTKVEWIELSLVAVGSNREALTRSAQRKVDFIEGKRQQREYEKTAASISEEELEEFGAMLLGDIPCETDAVDDDLLEFADMFGEKQEGDFAALF